MELLEPADALAFAADPEAVGVFADRPVVAVAARRGVEVERAARILAELPCVSLLVDVEGEQPSGAQQFDVAVTAADDPAAPWVHGDPQHVVDAVLLSPQAAVTLAQLLRLGDHLDVRAALVAESLAYGLLQSGSVYQRWLEAQPARAATPAADCVLVERDGATLRLVLNRPQVHNAFDTATRDGLAAGLQLAAADPSIERIEISGNGPTFCSGGDLREFGTVPDPVTGHLVRATRNVGWWMAGLRDRITVRVHGRCVGAGVELPAFAALVEADADATFRLPEVGMGLVPGAGGTASIPTRIGRQRTAWLALTGAELDAQTACRWRLVDRLK